MMSFMKNFHRNLISFHNNIPYVDYNGYMCKCIYQNLSKYSPKMDALYGS